MVVEHSMRRLEYRFDLGGLNDGEGKTRTSHETSPSTLSLRTPK